MKQPPRVDVVLTPLLFHGKLDGETTGVDVDAFERGLLLGVLIGEGHFGGDGRQPQVTVRMHTRHAQLFATLQRLCPASRLYGPYHHGGRSYYQWMVRGDALRQELVPLLDTLPLAETDTHVHERYQDMKRRYGL